MQKLTPVRTLGIFAVVALTTAAIPAVRRSPGITYDMVVTASAPAAMGAAGSYSMTARGAATADGSMRMDVGTVEGAAGMYAVGDYFLTSEGRMLVVHPASKTYVDVLDQALSALSNMPPEIQAQMNITGVTGATEKVSGSETLDGRPTEHYRTTLTYSMNMMGQALPVTTVSDYWIAKLSVKFVNPLTSWSKSALTTGPMAALMKKQVEIAPQITDGVAIKSVIATTISAMGQSMQTTVTSEMKNIKEGDVDASTFVLPPGFTKAQK